MAKKKRIISIVLSATLIGTSIFATNIVNTKAIDGGIYLDSYSPDASRTVTAGSQYMISGTFHTDLLGSGEVVLYMNNDPSTKKVISKFNSTIKDQELSFSDVLIAPITTSGNTFDIEIEVSGESYFAPIQLNVVKPSEPASIVPTDYLNWVDLAGVNGHVFFDFNSKKATDYSLDVYRDGSLINSQYIYASNVNVYGVTNFDKFNPGFVLPKYSDGTLSTGSQSRMVFNLYANIGGTKTLVYSGSENDLLSMHANVFTTSSIAKPHVYIK